MPAAPPVSLSSGDVLRVRISESKEGGLFAPLAGGGTLFDNVRVDHKGTILIPCPAVSRSRVSIRSASKTGCARV